MNNLFQKTNAYWAKYSDYEYQQDKDDNLYIMPTETALPSVYDPMKEVEILVVDAINVGRMAMKQDRQESELQQAVLGFVKKYGLLGFMTAIPITPDFIDYDAVYMLKNNFIKKETMHTKDYLSLFFPFGKPDIYKDREKSQWNVSSENLQNSGSAENFKRGRMVFALAQTFSSEPTAVGMSLLPIYAERYDWLVTQFQDWAFMLVSAFLFYDKKDSTDEFSRDLYRQGVSAFGNKAPTYHVSLYDDKPKIVWDFHSLLLTIQTMFGYALTDENRPVRLCKHCNLAFIAKNNNAAFCNHECKNQYNVNKHRGKQP
ncbi:MAG: hypothetical protein FWF81_06990 [Defluviitaleaceae bacterium]|nr:hypothetical protein [Defluviitaleaceae bacterium]